MLEDLVPIRTTLDDMVDAWDNIGFSKAQNPALAQQMQGFG